MNINLEDATTILQNAKPLCHYRNLVSFELTLVVISASDCRGLPTAVIAATCKYVLLVGLQGYSMHTRSECLHSWGIIWVRKGGDGVMVKLDRERAH